MVKIYKYARLNNPTEKPNWEEGDVMQARSPEEVAEVLAEDNQGFYDGEKQYFAIRPLGGKTVVIQTTSEEYVEYYHHAQRWNPKERTNPRNK